jgi:hypothetical protein
MDRSQNRPTEELSDEELLAQLRFVEEELSQERPFNREGDNRPRDILVEEIERRGLGFLAGRSLSLRRLEPSAVPGRVSRLRP